MTRVQLLQLVVQQARESGFAFRKWFVTSTAVDWKNADDAIAWLSQGERASLLLFSHSFARHFWRSGERVTFLVPRQTFQRVTQDGTRTIDRKAHLRRSSREDVWRFHLREMAAAAEPLRYIRRYLIVQEVIDEQAANADGGREELEEVQSYDDELLVREEEPPKPRRPAGKNNL